MYSSDIAFTPAVKAIQSAKGSRPAYARMERAGGWETTITPELKEFIEAQITVFLATANAAGQPYIQHRGGPAGFLVILDEKTLAFADFVGNRQFITTGNLIENPKALLFLMDYQEQRRIKLWGTAKVVEDDPDLVSRLMPKGYKARATQAIIFTVAAWDANCPQHIPRLVDVALVHKALAEKDARIQALEADLQALKNLQRT